MSVSLSYLSVVVKQRGVRPLGGLGKVDVGAHDQRALAA